MSEHRTTGAVREPGAASNHLIALGLDDQELAGFHSATVATVPDLVLHRLSVGQPIPQTVPLDRAILIADLDAVDADGRSDGERASIATLWLMNLLSRDSLRWVAVTSRPARFPEALCRFIGASAWFTRPLSEEDLATHRTAAARSLREDVTKRPNRLIRLCCAGHAMDATFQLRVVSRDDRRGLVELADGEVMYAAVEGAAVGLAALEAMARWECKDIRGGRVLQHAPDERNVEVPFATLFSRWGGPGESEAARNESGLHGVDSPREANADPEPLGDGGTVVPVTVARQDESPSADSDEAQQALREPEPTHDRAPGVMPDPPDVSTDPALTLSHSEVRSIAANLNSICQDVMENTAESVACGVVDLNTGMMLGAHHNMPYFTQAYLDAVAAAAVDMFRGKNVRRIEDLLTKTRGKSAKDSFEEVQITTPNTYHFMKVIKDKNAVVVLITRRTASLGMG